MDVAQQLVPVADVLHPCDARAEEKAVALAAAQCRHLSRRSHRRSLFLDPAAWHECEIDILSLAGCCEHLHESQCHLHVQRTLTTQKDRKQPKHYLQRSARRHLKLRH